jgi:hypothetical protein
MTALVNNSIVESVFFIKIDESTGSSFTITIKDEQYLISARHLFNNYIHNEEVTINLFHQEIWKTVKGNILHHSNPLIDVSVFRLPYAIAPKYIFSTSTNLMYGQDVFMLGFPYGHYQEVGEMNRNYPMAFIKKACFSSARKSIDEGVILFFDGHNNKGFSGGPIAHYDGNTNIASIHAIISGYIPQEGSINTPFGDWKYNENSGIVVSYSIKHAIEIIETIGIK